MYIANQQEINFCTIYFHWLSVLKEVGIVLFNRGIIYVQTERRLPAEST